MKIPTLLSSLAETPITDISCGYAFTIAVTSAGGLYSWGAGTNGRLGSGDEMNRMSPRLVTSIQNEFITCILSFNYSTCYMFI